MPNLFGLKVCRKNLIDQLSMQTFKSACVAALILYLISEGDTCTSVYVLISSPNIIFEKICSNKSRNDKSNLENYIR